MRRAVLLGGAWVLIHLGQVGCQVAGEPAVSGPEGLLLGGPGVTHDTEAVVERLEVHDTKMFI